MARATWSWLAEFRAFLAFTALCGIAFAVPHETTRTVAACAYLFLGPALFVLAVVDVVRHADRGRQAGAPRSAAETVALLPFRIVVALFGITTLLIGAAVCGWVLYLSHAGGAPILLSLFLGAIVMSRFFWARQAVSYGAGLVRVAFGKEEEPEEDDPGLPAAWDDVGEVWTTEDVELDPHGEVLVFLAAPGDEPDEAALAIVRELPVRYPLLLPALELELSALRLAAGEAPLARGTGLAGIWRHVELDHVRIARGEHGPTLELLFEPDWDPRAIVLRVHDWRRIEREIAG